ncbi:MAG: thioredoxin family protein [Flammeovirgaceae bacterium]|nr:thioredoxin family protein [Flammeovirgaceae bacterium]
MSLTSSNMLSLGAKAPKFNLFDTLSKQTKSYGSLKGPKGMLVMFICNHCPYVLHIQDALVAVGNKYLELGIGVVAISSNDIVAYPDDDPIKMEYFALNLGFKFPYLYDEMQEVAKAYEAACTPDFYLFDRHDNLVYRGRFDASRPGNDIKVTGKDLISSLELLNLGRPQPLIQLPSMGCNIKWRS